MRNKIGYNIAHNITRRLKELDRTMSWLARQVGVAPATTWSWAQGENVPSAHYLPDIAKALKVSIDELLSENTETN